MIYAPIGATGAGLHVVAYVIDGTTGIGTLGAILWVAVPVLISTSVRFLLYTCLPREADAFHVLLFVVTVALLALAIILAAVGASIGVCLMIVTLAPAARVVGFEGVGRRHHEAALQRTLA
ncbi:hypothetical protein ABIB15_001898 [Marisediminicola sp. UYEF4]|uniref:hypothetical protein n=1 Tax=Marisediminicola sp. UYEF4 TaxID=1756384 RepID=UPI00339A0EC3